ncbi:capsular polysaccharide synthesis protein [Lacticaseibacillus paracasei]
MKYLKKSIFFLNIDLKICRFFGIKAGFLDFLKNFILRDNQSIIGRRTYSEKYRNIISKLASQFSDVLSEFQTHTFSSADLCDIGTKSPIWFFWWQGVNDDTPRPVVDCLNSIIANSKEHPVIVLSKSNIDQYVEIPDFYYTKLKNGSFSLTHFSDILRIELLFTHGGIWMDSTIMMTEPLSKNIESSKFFTIHHGKFSDWHVSMGKWSGFFLATGKNNPMFHLLRDLMRAYWSQYDFLVCYLLIDCWIALAYDNWDSFKSVIDSVPINNQEVFCLDNHGNGAFSDFEYQSVQKSTTIFKIHYKRNFKLLTENGSETYYGHIVRQNELKKGQSDE